MPTDIRRERLGELFERHPGWVAVLEEFGIDGRHGTTITLAAAAERVGVDVEEVVAEISGRRDRWSCRSIDRAPIRAMIDHVEQVHHAFLRREFPRITQLIRAAQDGRPGDQRLTQLDTAFASLRADMEPHLASEEAVLFPVCRDLANAFSWPSFHSGPVVLPIELLRHDHDRADSLLDELTRIIDDDRSAESPMERPDEAELVAAIRSLDVDLRRHLAEENDLLFPRVLSLSAELDAT